jgi:hypothetical protein
MRVRLKGLNRVKKRLADGRVEVYFYAWKGGPRVFGKPGSPEFIASYNEAVVQKTPVLAGVLLSVLQAYQASEDFRGLANSTRRSYVPLIRRIERAFSCETASNRDPAGNRAITLIRLGESSHGGVPIGDDRDPTSGANQKTRSIP